MKATSFVKYVFLEKDLHRSLPWYQAHDSETDRLTDPIAREIFKQA